MNIAVLRYSRLGDLLFTTPALRFLRDSLPDAHLCLVTTERYCDLIPRPGLVDEVVAMRPRSLRELIGRWLGRVTVPRQLAGRRWDTVISFSNRDHHLALAHALKPGRIVQPGPLPPRALPMPPVTLLDAARYELNRSLLPDFRSVPYPGRHVVASHVGVVATLVEAEPLCIPPMEIHVGREDQDEVDRRLGRLGQERPLIWVHPGVHGSHRHSLDEASKRSWRAERWSEVLRDLVAAGHDVAVTSGSPKEARSVAAIAPSDSPHCRCLPDLSAGQLGALGRRARLFLGVDSGPMHVAAAAGCPVLALFGPSRLEMSGPWCREPSNSRILRTDLPCSPCKGSKEPCRLNQCMAAIQAADVLEAVREMV